MKTVANVKDNFRKENAVYDETICRMNDNTAICNMQ
jgi:hypothetical protein